MSIDTTKQPLNSLSYSKETRTEDISFNPNAILRGAQLTVVGTLRALQNPELFRSEIYKQARIAVGAGLAIKVVIEAPIVIVRMLLSLFAAAASVEHVRYGPELIKGLNWILNSGLQLPYVLIGLLNIYMLHKSLDDVFWLSLRWVDKTYLAKHAKGTAEELIKPKPLYSENLESYPADGQQGSRQSAKEAARRFLFRFGRKASMSLLAILLSYIPYIGRLSLPLMSFIAFKDAVGLVPASSIFALGILLPQSYLASFLQTYYGSRSLMRELLGPFLRKISFTPKQQRDFFKAREGVFFGFSFTFYLILKIPVFGVLAYGLAEASTAYLLTKVVDPPPPPNQRKEYAAQQIIWTNRKSFLDLQFSRLDADRDAADTSKVASTELFRISRAKRFT